MDDAAGGEYQMSIPGYEIYIGGVPRTFRDVKETAIDAAMRLKLRNLSAPVFIVETATGARAEIVDVNRPPEWKATSV